MLELIEVVSIWVTVQSGKASAQTLPLRDSVSNQTLLFDELRIEEKAIEFSVSLARMISLPEHRIFSPNYRIT
jgi:hypothetical protein